jgi:hypothetical protein
MKKLPNSNPTTSCNFLSSDVLEASVPGSPLSVRIEYRIHNLTAPVFSSLQAVLNPRKEKTKTSVSPSPEHDVLNLQPGEWVQVRSIDEISRTLDEAGKYKGLYFMPAMEKYCGKKFRVFKKAAIIKLESTGEVRKLRSPSVFLEGVYCDGERHKGCDRACFHFWREAWLKKVPEPLQQTVEETTNEKTTPALSPSPEHEGVNLQPGEWVQVKSVDEIGKTLDERRKYEGLYFMPEMEKFCEKKFRVFKRAEIIKLESTGEVRKLKSPSVFLEGVYCDGEYHEGCDRACYHFWREMWLKRIPDV